MLNPPDNQQDEKWVAWTQEVWSDLVQSLLGILSGDSVGVFSMGDGKVRGIVDLPETKTAINGIPPIHSNLKSGSLIPCLLRLSFPADFAARKQGTA